MSTAAECGRFGMALTPREGCVYTGPTIMQGAAVKLGLDTYSYRYAAGLWDYTPRGSAPMALEHYLQKAADLNLDGVQLCDARHLESLEYGYVSGVRERAESLGLYVEVGTAGTNADHLESMVRVAHVVGSPVVRTFVGKPRPRTAEGMHELLSATAGEIAQVTPVCERYGVSLALENHQDLRADELLSLLELVQSAGASGGSSGVCDGVRAADQERSPEGLSGCRAAGRVRVDGMCAWGRSGGAKRDCGLSGE